MISKLLIANRGEIAIRVARSAAALGIETHAIFSGDDAPSLHVSGADGATQLPLTGAAAYLDIPSIIRIARDAGCDAVHPGYGFLSENADFAAACGEAGLIFVGPAPETLRALGDKVAARDLARQAGVPVIGGSGPLDSATVAQAFLEAQNGAPILIKAVNGGGGRGMRVVHSGDDIASALAQARAEAQAAFGDGAVYGERYLDPVRHIEVQIIGDGENVTHLWDRDCTLQRRHQKIVEIAPAPFLSETLRAALLDAAVALGKAARYRGLGTVEFLVEANGASDSFHFIEMNPRIQVEHTITEEITGLDLVALQLNLAGGATLADLGLESTPAAPQGIAIQARINAETIGPDGQVLPGGGTLNAFQQPGGPGVRVDTYGYPGYTTNPGFDSLLAKLIVHDRSGDLSGVLARTVRALSEFQITGTPTNTDYLRALLGRPELATWAVDVTSVDRGLVGAKDIAALPPARIAATPAAAPAPSASAALTLPQGAEALCAPMQGMIHAINAQPGDRFAAGDELVILEAMKMQHVVTAPAAGTVIDVLNAPGTVVSAAAPLLSFEPDHTAQDSGADTAQRDLDEIRPDLQALQDRLAFTLDENRPDAVARRRSRGQRTARENVNDLCRGGTFHEYGQLVVAAQRRRRDREDLIKQSPADGIITGLGEVNAGLVPRATAQVAVLAYDASVMAGTQGMFGHMKTDRLFEVAERQHLPMIFFTEGGGGRPGDVDFADIKRAALDITTFHAFARMKGRGPRITVNSGYCFAGNAAIFGAGDIKIATRKSWIGLGGPAMIEAGGLGTFDPKEIGPAPEQAEIGLVDILVEDEEQATEAARKAMSYFQGNLVDWSAADQRALRHVIPGNRLRAYDVRSVIGLLADTGSFLELGRAHAPGIVAGFLRIEGRPMGLIANNPHHLGGALDAPASAKAARFIRLCNRFSLPVLSLCDTPGFMVGPDSERAGGVQAACDLLAAGAEMEQPLFFVCLRKGYGIGAQGMAGGSFVAPAFTLSWPTGEFGPMGLEGAVTLGFKRELDAETDPAKRQALFDDLVAQSYREGSALNVASLQEIDAVIDPMDTRDWIIKGLDIRPEPTR
ncbi:acetyl-CoA carboxylase family protein [Arenibacterium sp. CAU 1754]